ncbi:hypothetical protein EVAR_21650_1 [Eumeta japonica]|uniref:Uncharacterized protein n=1 Tax=Eumeta variegata TaxID=151549 RepID=A0A4C1VHN8_EUMVA|nr:hypothetical protein EVAR_21650_1 [Eumeta japonica]
MQTTPTAGYKRRIFTKHAAICIAITSAARGAPGPLPKSDLLWRFHAYYGCETDVQRKYIISQFSQRPNVAEEIFFVEKKRRIEAKAATDLMDLRKKKCDCI